MLNLNFQSKQCGFVRRLFVTSKLKKKLTLEEKFQNGRIIVIFSFLNSTPFKQNYKNKF